MKNPTYNAKGEKKGEVNLPENVFAVSWNGDLVHQDRGGLELVAQGTNGDAKNIGGMRAIA